MNSPKPVVDLNFYQQPSTISYFDAILEDLRQDLGAEGNTDATFTAPELAYFVGRFQQFQQDALGKQAIALLRQTNNNNNNNDNTTNGRTINSTSHPVRIPSSLFRVESLRKGSPLYVILLAAYSFLSDKDTSDWQFESPDEKEVYFELLKYIRKRLVDSGVMEALPMIGFDAGIPTDMKNNLTSMVMNMEGYVVDDLTGATHIIYNNEDPLFDDSQPRPFSVEEKLAGKVLLHYIGLPSSYDTWVNENEYNDDMALSLDSTLQQQPYRLKVSWIKDSYTYNEWMNPIDYHYSVNKSEASITTSNLKRSIKEGNADTDDENPSKKVKPSNEQAGSDLKEMNDEQQPQQHTKDDSENPLTASISSQQEQQQQPQDKQQKEELISHGVKTGDIITERNDIRYQSIQGHEIVIPSYAAWFELHKVNDIERNSLPEFFNSKSKWKTPTTYKNYRDFMVNSYRINPVEYLTITACRRNLMGDVCAIIRVHSFLEQWGLINYQVEANTKSSVYGIPETEQLKIIHEQYTSPTVQELPKQINDEDMEQDIKTEQLNIKKDSDGDIDMQKEDDKDSIQQISGTTCATCESHNMDIRYQSTQRKDVQLCESCYLDGKYAWDLRPSQFIKQIHPSTPSPSSPVSSPPSSPPTTQSTSDNKQKLWTDEEKTLLQEGLEKYHDDWNKISDHVKTRTRDQCLLQYLQLPTENPYVDTEVSQLGLLQFDRSQDSCHPVLSTVAFLASTVKPKVAAAAANGSPDFIEDTDKPLDKQEQSIEQKDDLEKELRDLLYGLIGNKLRQFQAQTRRYEEKEVLLEEERRLLEKERHQLNQDQLALQSKILAVRQELAKRDGHQQYDIHGLGFGRGGDGQGGNINMHHSNVGMTPAQVQQQMAAAAAAAATAAAAAAQGQGSVPNSTANGIMRPGMGQPPMFMNHQQHQNYMRFQQQQQQQMQIQLQMQMQQEQRQGSGRPNQ
ncbi:uncharacterized protein BX664DRAFT_282208, partial [Halteromyces radiatus]|uniref:uncharacterized protein n=1 Tax=Halteromyces radiatus TaxID=101107 RepID=UPI00221FAB0D